MLNTNAIMIKMSRKINKNVIQVLLNNYIELLIIICSVVLLFYVNVFHYNFCIRDHSSLLF